VLLGVKVLIEILKIGFGIHRIEKGSVTQLQRTVNKLLLKLSLIAMRPE
jgi:hypothetical protein